MLHWFLRNVGIDLGLDWEKMHAYDLPKVIAAYELLPEIQKRQAEENAVRSGTPPTGLASTKKRKPFPDGGYGRCRERGKPASERRSMISLPSADGSFGQNFRRL